MTLSSRTERDSLGEVQVPSDALYGAQTQRAVENFAISSRRMPREFIWALGLLKRAAAEINAELGLLERPLANAIAEAAQQVADGRHDAQFVVDVFQTGSGTSSNMNANEVIARLASRSLGQPVHPNDHVNMCQSSNDVIPSCIHLSATAAIERELLPAFAQLASAIDAKAASLAGVVKTGRTHLMDAMPLRFDQELGAWASQVRDAATRIEDSLPRLRRLALGGTAVGTGINAHPEFADAVVSRLCALTRLALAAAPDRFREMAAQDSAVEVSGQLRAGAVALTKICNDLRWMNSGPLAGLGEIRLPALQPGSSIMPGKVNPVIPEAVAMACAQVIGNDLTIAVAGQSGSFQLNVMLPVIASNLLESALLLSNGARHLADRAVAGLEVERERVDAALARNPILVTALNPVIGYEQGALVAKRAYAEGRAVKDVARELTDLDEETLDRLLDPAQLTRGGLPD